MPSPTERRPTGRDIPQAPASLPQGPTPEELTIARTSLETGLPPYLLWRWLSRAGELRRTPRAPQGREARHDG